MAQISAGVATLREIALDMGSEVQKQNAMIGEIDEQVDRTNEKLKGLNKQLKKTLQSVRRGDKIVRTRGAQHIHTHIHTRRAPLAGPRHHPHVRRARHCGVHLLGHQEKVAAANSNDAANAGYKNAI